MVWLLFAVCLRVIVVNYGDGGLRLLYLWVCLIVDYCMIDVGWVGC